MAMVCLCRGVSERAVATAIDRGACTVEEVGASCRAGTGCGVCRATIGEMLAGSAPAAGACVGVRRRAALVPASAGFAVAAGS